MNQFYSSRTQTNHAQLSSFTSYFNSFNNLINLALQEARVYAEENGLFFMETSAKTAANVNDIFYEIGVGPFPSHI